MMPDLTEIDYEILSDPGTEHGDQAYVQARIRLNELGYLACTILPGEVYYALTDMGIQTLREHLDGL